MGKPEPGGLPSFLGGFAMYITYEDLVQIGIFVVVLVGLCYEIFEGKGK